MKINNLIRLLAVSALCILSLPVLSQSVNKIKVLAYFLGPAASLDNFDASQFTHIIFCFGQLEENRFKISKDDSATIKKMVSLKKRNPQLKVILSLGGGRGCKTCSDVFATKAGREDFAPSQIQISLAAH